jgi:hypothetical protein
MMLDVGFLSLPHGFELLEDNIHNSNEPLGGKLAMSRSEKIPFIHDLTLDPMPPWGTLIELQANHPIILFIRLGTHCRHQVHKRL